MPFKTTYSFYLVHRDVFLTFDKVMPRHQELKSAGKLKQKTIELYEILNGSLDNIIFVSHRWPAPGNPFDAAGSKIKQIQCFLLGNPSAELIFMDWPCLPQVPRTPEENIYFFQTLEVMLTNLVAGVRVVALWDADFNRRFWPSIETIFGMKTPTKDGLVPATKEQDRMFFINHTPGLALAHLRKPDSNDKTLKTLQDRTWRNRSLEDARRTLADDLYAVTNKSDKETNLKVLEWMDDNLREFQNDPSDIRLRELWQADNFPDVCVTLELRNGASKTIKLPNGTPVEVVSTNGEWAEIRLQSKTGKAKRRNLRPLSADERLRRRRARQALGLEGEWSMQEEVEEGSAFSVGQQQRWRGYMWFCEGKRKWTTLVFLALGVLAMMAPIAILWPKQQGPSPPTPPPVTPTTPAPPAPPTPQKYWLVCPDLQSCNRELSGTTTEFWSVQPKNLALRVGNCSKLPGLDKTANAKFAEHWGSNPPTFKGSPVRLTNVADFMRDLLSSDPFDTDDKVPYINFNDALKDGQAITITQRQLAFVVANVLMGNNFTSKRQNGLSAALARCVGPGKDGSAIMYSLFSFLAILSKELAGGKDGTLLIAARPTNIRFRGKWKDGFSNIIRNPNICNRVGGNSSQCNPGDFMTGGTHFQALTDVPLGTNLGGNPGDPSLFCNIEDAQDKTLMQFYSEVMAFAFFSENAIPVPVAFLGVRRYVNNIDGNRKGRLCGEIATSNWLNSDIENQSNIENVPIGTGINMVHANMMTSSFVAVKSVDSEERAISSWPACTIAELANNMCEAQRVHVYEDMDLWYQAFESTFYNTHMQAAFKGVLKRIGTGPWGSGNWKGDSQIYFLTMMLATSALQGITLDYYMYESFCENGGNQCFVLGKDACKSCIGMDRPLTPGFKASNCGPHGYEDIMKSFKGKTVREMYSAITTNVGRPPRQCFDNLVKSIATV